MIIQLENDNSIHLPQNPIGNWNIIYWVFNGDGDVIVACPILWSIGYYYWLHHFLAYDMADHVFDDDQRIWWWSAMRIMLQMGS